MLQNARVTIFTVSELLRENKQWGRGKIINLPSPRLGLIKYKRKETSLVFIYERMI